MAFAKQYFSSYKSNNNLDYYLEIWVDGYTGGNPTEIKLGAGGPVISYDTDQEDRFSPILSSQCELPFMVTGISTESFITLLRTTYQEKQVYLHLYRATSSTYTTTKPIWSGFLVMDLGSGEDVAFPYEQKLRFVDGLSLLKDIDFVDLSKSGSETNIQGSYTQDNMYYGPAIYTFWIKEILKKIGSATTTQGVSINYGFTTAVNWYNADMQNTNQGSDPLGLTQCVVSMFHNKNEQDVFTPENCYTVLKEILRHWGARITYWKHEFWIVQIPEYITTESGFIDNPDNINSRQYDLSGSLIGSQDHLGDTFYTRYEQTIQSNQVSKIVGTKYNYLPIVHNVEADFLSLASQNYYGGFPYGVSAENQEIFQGTIIDASTADFLWLSIPLNWVWDMSGTSLPNGHTNGWWSYVKFNFYASNGTTTYYLQYNSSNDSYYWVIEADWIPLGNTSPKYIIKSRNITETNYIGFEEQIPFVDSSGNAIAMSGAWSFFLDIEKFGTNSSNVGSFYCRFSGYPPSSYYSYVKADPTSIYPTLPNPSGSGTTFSGKVSWSNTLQNPSGIVATSFSTSAGFDAGTSQADIQLITSSPFKGFLQTLNTTQSATFGISLNTQIDNSTNTEAYNFGTLLWGDAFEQFAIGCLRVNNGSTFVKTNPDGEWGRGILTGEKTFTELLINEFLTGQIEVVITPTMRLAVGDQNKNQTASASGGGTAERPRYVNPIGILRETRNGVDPVYFFKRGSFHSLYDEWDYEGYQILRDSVTSTTTSNDIGGLGGSQDNNPVSAAKIIGNVTDALMMNSPIAYLRTTVQATGANVVVNGNFNVATGWVLGTGWSIDTTASKAKFAATGSLSSLSQINLTEGTKYQIIFTIDITAGQLSVKAGTSGGSQVITVSGQYEIYLLCGGSTSIEFQAGTTFTGSISQVSIAEQKSLSSVPIESLGEAVFKTNDTLNLVNSIGGDIIPLNVTSNQGATDTAISVTAVPLFDDIGSNSVLLINQDDLSAQYQNKTKGTVAGFDITATGIEKSSINITDWLNSDTMSGAAVTNVPTALSVKNYVDGQVGANDTLQEVTDNGNTTTNSIMIGSSSSPNANLQVEGVTNLSRGNKNLFINPNVSNANVYSSISSGSGMGLALRTNSSAESLRITSTGKVGIGTTSPSVKLDIAGTDSNYIAKFTHSTSSGYAPGSILLEAGQSVSRGQGVYHYNNVANENWFTGVPYAVNSKKWIVANLYSTAQDVSTAQLQYALITIDSDSGNVGINTNSPTEKLHVVGDALITGDSHADAFKPAATGQPIKFKNFASTTEFARITDGGNLLLGTTSDSGIKLVVNSGTDNVTALFESTDAISEIRIKDDSAYTRLLNSAFTFKIMPYNGVEMMALDGNNENINIPTYSGTNQTGTATYLLGTDVNGKIVKTTTIPSGSGGPYLPLTGGTLTGDLLLGTTSAPVDLFLFGDTAGTSLTWSNSDDELQFSDNTKVTFGDSQDLQVYYDGVDGAIKSATGIQFLANSATKMTLTSGGNLLLGTTFDNNSKLRILGATSDSTKSALEIRNSSSSALFTVRNDGRIDASGVVNLSGSLTGTTATFTGQVTIPATPIATTDAASKSYVDAHGGGLGPFLPLSAGTGFPLTGDLYLGTNGGGEKYLRLESDTASSYLELQSLGNVARIKATNNTNLLFQSDGGGGYQSWNNNGAERMRLTSGGNLLLGTTTDSGYKLDINGSLRVSSSSVFTSKITAGYGVSFTNGNTEFLLYNNPGENVLYMRDVTNGAMITYWGVNDFKVYKNLIGTTATFSGDLRFTNANQKIYVDLSSTVIRTAEIQLYNGSDGSIQYKTFNASTGGHYFFTQGSEKFRLNRNGNVLIGSTSDNGNKLQVSGIVNVSDGVYMRGANSAAYNGDGTYILDVGKMVNDKSIRTAGNVLLGGSLTGTTATFSGNILPASNISSSLGSSSKSFLYTYTYVVQSGGILQLNTGGTERVRITSGGNFIINSTSDNGQQLQVTGNIRITGGFQASNTGGFLLADTGGSMRYGLKYGAAGAVGGSNLLMLTNRSLSNATGGGEVAIGANASTTGVTETEVMRIKANTQSQVSIDGVLSLTSQNTPADPPNRASTIWLDSNFDLKIKITNNSGVTVTKTLAEYA